jgi:hypothetical protein
MTRRVARGEQILRKALLREYRRRSLYALSTLLHLQWRFDESYSEAGFQMPLDVACTT